MFFEYPVIATAENWLHEVLCEMLMIVHASIEAGEDAPDWPGIIPAAHRVYLKSRKGLRDLLNAYAEAASELSADELAQVEVCLIEQNDLVSLFDCTGECEIISDLPEAIREVVVDLFTFAYDLLTDLGIRDRQYREIYSTITDPVCPFCGSEYFDAPESHREDLDHYLARTLYPFAATNLRNLAPMGRKCNGYKQQQDLLRDALGVRRPSFDPYAARKLTVSLLDSVPFGAEDGQTPQWQIDFDPDSAECVTWNVVFSFRDRMERDVLNKFFWPWLGQFAAWFVRRKGLADVGDDQITEALWEYQEDMELQGFRARDFMRAHVFEMLAVHCQLGYERLLELMRDLITQAVPPPPVDE
jgi:hypothetical protein